VVQPLILPAQLLAMLHAQCVLHRDMLHHYLMLLLLLPSLLLLMHVLLLPDDDPAHSLLQTYSLLQIYSVLQPLLSPLQERGLPRRLDHQPQHLLLLALQRHMLPVLLLLPLLLLQEVLVSRWQLLLLHLHCSLPILVQTRFQVSRCWIAGWQASRCCFAMRPILLTCPIVLLSSCSPSRLQTSTSWHHVYHHLHLHVEAILQFFAILAFSSSMLGSWHNFCQCLELVPPTLLLLLELAQVALHCLEFQENQAEDVMDVQVHDHVMELQVGGLHHEPLQQVLKALHRLQVEGLHQYPLQQMLKALHQLQVEGLRQEPLHQVHEPLHQLQVEGLHQEPLEQRQQQATHVESWKLLQVLSRLAAVTSSAGMQAADLAAASRDAAAWSDDVALPAEAMPAVARAVGIAEAMHSAVAAVRAVA
jgi:hypothetical protein